MNLVYGSVCSGIEAATVAWECLGWRPAFFAEIDSFASSVLAHHYPQVINYGDFRNVPAELRGTIDVLVAGTPCQSFSIAGKRAGLDDSRGNLTLEFFDLVGRLRPRWVVWENVPGVFSQDGGRAFGTVLGKVEQLGYEFAWRTLDAQYFGVPQRRRRVFLVCHSGELERRTGASAVQVQGRFRNLPAAVLFERHCLSGDSAPSKAEGEGVATDVAGSLGGGGERGWTDDLDRSGAFIPRFWDGGDVADCLDVSSMLKQQMMPERRESAAVLASENGGPPNLIRTKMSVRRLTPIECERLQGFPDNYTLVPYRNKLAADGPRYKAIGNSFAVPVVRWIGVRIEMVEKLLQETDPSFAQGAALGMTKEKENAEISANAG